MKRPDPTFFLHFSNLMIFEYQISQQILMLEYSEQAPKFAFE